jgi:hypothetical protein
MKLTEEIKKTLVDALTFPDDNQLQQRGIADKLEQSCNVILTETFTNTIPATSRRSIEDITVNDCYVDHKTSDVSLKFKMPNLISIDRLHSLKKPLIYNFVKYDSSKKEILDILVLDIYELNWDHLSIQNLGVGQLQIKSMVSFFESPTGTLTKEQWIERLEKEAISFYDKLLTKTLNRKKKWTR